MHTYYDKHFFEFMPQGVPNFSWRIKKSDHQRNSISDGSSDEGGSQEVFWMGKEGTDEVCCGNIHDTPANGRE